SPLTAFNEMDVLDRAGTFGWHSVAFGPLYHVVVKSEEQWEHRRVSVIGANRHQLEAEGWQRIGSMWFPWAYYARPTGRPALAEPVSEDHLLSRWSGKPSTTAGGKAERGDA